MWAFQRTHNWTPKIQDCEDPPSWTLTPKYKNAIFSKIGNLQIWCLLTIAYVVMWCLSICLSCPYILSKRIKLSSKLFHHRVATPFQFFHTKWHSNILMETPTPTRALNAGGVGRNHDSEPISGFSACC